MRKIFAIPLLTLGVLGVSAAAAYVFLPWQNIAGQRLQAILESKGFQNVQLTLSDIGLTGATLQDITVGEDPPLTLRNLTLAYTPTELWAGTLNTLDIKELKLTMQQVDGAWSIQGLKSSSSGAPFTLPATPESLSAIPFSALTLSDSAITVMTPTWRLDAPLDGKWQRQPETQIEISSKQPRFEMGKINATAA
ncbi:MAG: hypothetical protein KKA05_07745, partial [Alphaproteobacteria bacterium]|nr:hypothetical protein [Alphaproteobacteria bacterium]